MELTVKSTNVGGVFTTKSMHSPVTELLQLASVT